MPLCVAVFLACIVISRILAERALRTLSPEEKVRLVDGFSGMRAYSLLPAVVIVVAALAVPQFFPGAPGWSPLLGLGLVAAYMVGVHFFIARKLARLRLPADYIQRFLFARHLGNAGVAVLFAGIILGSLGH